MIHTRDGDLLLGRGLNKDFVFDCFVIYFVCAVELRHTDEMMVAVDNRFRGGGWVVHILDFEAVE